jgi:hypothetical protein
MRPLDCTWSPVIQIWPARSSMLLARTMPLLFTSERAIASAEAGRQRTLPPSAAMRPLLSTSPATPGVDHGRDQARAADADRGGTARGQHHRAGVHAQSPRLSTWLAEEGEVAARVGRELALVDHVPPGRVAGLKQEAAVGEVGLRHVERGGHEAAHVDAGARREQHAVGVGEEDLAVGAQPAVDLRCSRGPTRGSARSSPARAAGTRPVASRPMEKLCQSMPSRRLDCTMVSVGAACCSCPLPV